MKALSLWEPWASMLVHGIKKIETRSWSTNFRGPLMVHAAKKRVDMYEYFSTSEYMSIVNTFRHKGLKLSDFEKTRGCLLGVVRLVDCKRIYEGDTGPYIWDEENNMKRLISNTEQVYGDYRDGRYAWITEPMQLLSYPHPFRGKQRLFHVGIGGMRIF